MSVKSKKCGGLGLHRLRPWRMALVSKHAANVLSNPDNVWVQLVKAKYCFEISWLGYAKSKKCSWMWRSICESAQALPFHHKACVGSGHNMDILTSFELMAYFCLYRHAT